MATTTIPSWDDNVTDWDQPDTFWDISRKILKPLPVNSATVYVQFLPSSTTNFQFQATLDGNSYIVICNWSLYGQRYYINLYDSTQKLVLCMPMIGSPNFYNISLTAGYFTTMLVFRSASNTFEIIG